MTAVLVDVDREAIKQACVFHGGARAVAQKARIQPSSLTRWFKGGKTLSTAAVLEVLDTLGMPKGVVDTQIVHEWFINWKSDKAFQRGMAVYFPGGAEVARAPWSRWSIEGLYRQLTTGLATRDNPPEIYALTDGNVRAVLRRAPGVPLTLKEFGKKFTWKGGSIEASQLNIDVWNSAWIEGGITPQMFDMAWRGETVTWDDVAKCARERGYDPKHLIEFMKKNTPSSTGELSD